MTNECGIGIGVTDSLAPWQENPGLSRRGSAPPSLADTQTITWPSTRRELRPTAFRSAITSHGSWPQRTGSPSRRTCTGTLVIPSCSKPPGRDKGLETERAPRGRGKRGRLAHHPNEEGRSVLAHASVPANALAEREGRSTRLVRPLPLTLPPGYCVSTRHDMSVHNDGGTCDRSRYRSSDAAAEDATQTTHSRRQHRPLQMARRSPAQGQADHGGSDQSSARAVPGRRGAISSSRGEGRRVSATGGNYFVGTHKGPRQNLWPDRRDPFMSNTQRVLRTCAHREGTANERIRARLG